jgi:hypothetical protein
MRDKVRGTDRGIYWGPVETMGRTKMLIAKIALTIVAAYVIVVAMIAIMQTNIIFPSGIADAQAPVLPPDAIRLEAVTANGERLVGTHFRPRRDNGHSDTMVLGFGGNAANADGTAIMLQGLYPGAHVVAFHYRGYRPSSGDASAAALVADALIVHDFAVAAVRPKRVIAVGISVGSGVAAYLAKHRALSGLILVTPFDSIASVARAHYPWAPVSLLLRHRMPTIRYLEEQTTPTAVIAAERDRIVPPDHTAALKPAIRNLVFEHGGTVR